MSVFSSKYCLIIKFVHYTQSWSHYLRWINQRTLAYQGRRSMTVGTTDQCDQIGRCFPFGPLSNWIQILFMWPRAIFILTLGTFSKNGASLSQTGLFQRAGILFQTFRLLYVVAIWSHCNWPPFGTSLVLAATRSTTL